MENALRLRVIVGKDHTIRLPDEVPLGEAEIIVLMPKNTEEELAHRAEVRKRLFNVMAGKMTIADDFDAPLPDEILNDFEGPIEP